MTWCCSLWRSDQCCSLSPVRRAPSAVTSAALTTLGVSCECRDGAGVIDLEGEESEIISLRVGLRRGRWRASFRYGGRLWAQSLLFDCWSCVSLMIVGARLRLTQLKQGHAPKCNSGTSLPASRLLPPYASASDCDLSSPSRLPICCSLPTRDDRNRVICFLQGRGAIHNDGRLRATRGSRQVWAAAVFHPRLHLCRGWGGSSGHAGRGGIAAWPGG